mgnify:FL=1
MRRMEKEFQKWYKQYKKELQTYGNIDDEDTTFRTSQSKNNDRDSIAKDCELTLDYKNLCILGCLDVSMYYDGSFDIGKEQVPFYVNDLISLQKVIQLFYGTPFSLRLEKVNRLDFVRYKVSVETIHAQNFRLLSNYLDQLSICLHQVHIYCFYD